MNISSFYQEGESEGSSFRNPLFAALALRPTQEAYKADGSPEFINSMYEQVFNPLAIQQYDRDRNTTTNCYPMWDWSTKSFQI